MIQIQRILAKFSSKNQGRNQLFSELQSNLQWIERRIKNDKKDRKEKEKKQKQKQNPDHGVRQQV